MSALLRKVRGTTAAMFVILGAIIATRGIAQAASWTFVLLGVLLIVLGIYRLIVLEYIGGPDLTPSPPSLPGKGEPEAPAQVLPSLGGKGARGLGPDPHRR
jgi:hypothetical protein